jgi:hypothetical protein
MFTATYTDVFSGNLVTPAFPQYSAITLNANITMSWPAQFQNLNLVVSLIMQISPTANGFTVRLPDAREVGTGVEFTIDNPTANSFTLLNNAGAPIVVVAGPSVSDFWLTSNATQGGTWVRVPRGGGVASVTSVGAVSTSNNLVITGSPIINMGVFGFSFARDLLSLSTFGAAAGITVRIADGNWNLVSILGTANQIVVTNGSGVLGSPTISLPPVISGITSIALPNLSFGVAGPNVISSTNINGPITLTPNGTGIIQLSKEADIMAGNALKFFTPAGTNYISFRLGATLVNQDLLWPTTIAVAGQVLRNSGGGVLDWASVTTFGGPSTVNALARYSNLTGSLKDSILILDDAGNATGLLSCRIGHIVIGAPDQQTITTVAANEDLIVAPNGVGALSVCGNILVKPSSATQRGLRLYNTAGTFYASLKSNAAIVANVGWFLPATDSVGTFVSDGAGNMSIQPATAYFPAVSTLNAVPRYSNLTGFPLKDSLFVIDDAGAGTGLVSCVIGAISLGVAATNTIVTTGVNQDLNITPNGTGALVVSSHLQVNPTAGAANSLKLFNNAGTFFSAFKGAAGLLASTTWTLPSADSIGIFTSNGAGTIAITALTSYFPAASTVNAVPRYSNITGSPLKDSLFIIDDAGAGSGLTSCVIGAISLGTAATNTIITTGANQNLNITPNGTGALVVSSHLQVNPTAGAANSLKLFNNAGTFFSALKARAILLGSTTWTLPAADFNALMGSNGAGELTLGTGLTAPGAGKIGLGTTTFEATSTNSITFLNGTAAVGAAAANSLTLQSFAATSTVGTTLGWYGSGTGGIYASVANASTHKINIKINGVDYYIMATTVA